MADPYFAEAWGFTGVTIGSTDVVAGDALYFDGTDWELADASDNTKFTELLAAESFDSGARGIGVVGGILVDTDAPYTQGSSMYLSETAGAITATRPTGAESLAQVLGFCLSTSEVKMEVGPLREQSISLTPITDGTAAFAQNADWTGVLLAAANEASGYTFEVPRNMVERVTESLWWTVGASSPALDASDTYTIDVSGGIDDETTTTTEDGITAAALTVADNDLKKADVSAAFDATGLIAPGNVIGVDVDKAAEGAGGDDPLMLCLVVTYRVVG
jgi:hypothetical protein